jgi:hypothetical protein
MHNEFLGARLGVAGTQIIPPLAEFIRPDREQRVSLRDERVEYRGVDPARNQRPYGQNIDPIAL